MNRTSAAERFLTLKCQTLVRPAWIHLSENLLPPEMRLNEKLLGGQVADAVSRVLRVHP